MSGLRPSVPLVCVTVLVLGFLTAPMLASFWLSSSPTEVLSFPPKSFSLRWYADFLGNERWVLATRNSLVVATATMAVATVLGTAVTVLASLSTFDGTLLRAAALLGAPPLRLPPRVAAARLARGAAGSVFAFATSLDEFVITLFLAGPAQFTLPRQMYTNVREYMTPTILVASSILFLASFAFLLLTEVLRKR
jgi:ABC-type spermidine/putrescine transport system permease subunit II